MHIHYSIPVIAAIAVAVAMSGGGAATGEVADETTCHCASGPGFVSIATSSSSGTGGAVVQQRQSVRVVSNTVDHNESVTVHQSRGTGSVTVVQVSQHGAGNGSGGHAHRISQRSVVRIDGADETVVSDSRVDGGSGEATCTGAVSTANGYAFAFGLLDLGCAPASTGSEAD